MDIMDSTDTPTGGLDGTTASSGALPLSVDQRDAFASPTNAARSGGSQPTHSSSSFSSSSSAFDRLDYVNATGGDHVEQDLPNGLPTSQDDVFMPTTEYASHPSLLSSDAQQRLPTVSTSSQSSVKEQAKETASEAKAKAAELAESAKSGMSHLKDRVASSLHTAEDKAESAYHGLKKDVQSHLPHSSTSSTSTTVETPVRSTVRAEPTDTHPAAASMRDSHLHPGMVSLPTHANEQPSATTTHISANHAAALHAASQAEPKDPTASSGVMGALSSLHAKLEDGAERVKGKVDDWAEKHLRTERQPGEHLSEAHVRDLPTLVDGTNEKNSDKVRQRLHPSGERAGGVAQFDTEDVIDSI